MSILDLQTVITGNYNIFWDVGRKVVAVYLFIRIIMLGKPSLFSLAVLQPLYLLGNAISGCLSGHWLGEINGCIRVYIVVIATQACCVI